MAKANSMPVQAVCRAFVLRMVGTPSFCKLQLSASLAAGSHAGSLCFECTRRGRVCQGIKNLHISRRKRPAFCREQLEKDGKIVYSYKVSGKLCLCVEENNIIHYIKEN